MNRYHAAGNGAHRSAYALRHVARQRLAYPSATPPNASATFCCACDERFSFSKAVCKPSTENLADLLGNPLRAERGKGLAD